MKNKAHSSHAYKVLVAAHDQLFGRALIQFIQSHQWPSRTEFHIVHVIEDNPLKKPLILPQDVVDDLTEEEDLAGKDVLNFMARQIYSSVEKVRVARHLVRGDAVHEILKIAKQLPAKMICLGSHGRAGFERLMLGSVATAVVAHAPCSTVVLRLSKNQMDEFTQFEFNEKDFPDRMREEMEIHVEHQARK